MSPTGKPGPSLVDRGALLLATATQTAGLGVIVALLAELQDQNDLPTWGLGLIAGISFITAFTGYLGLSRFADRGHARGMLLIGAVLGGASMVWMAFASDLWSLIAARALFGLGDGTFVPAARRAVLDWSPGRPGTELSRLMAASIGGFMLGPVAGAWIAETLGLRAAFLIPAGVIAFTLPIIMRLRLAAAPVARDDAPMRRLMRSPLVRAALWLGATEFFLIGGIEAIWARLLTDRGASTTVVGISFVVVIAPMVVLAPLAGRLVDRHGPDRIVLVAAGFMVAIAPFYGPAGTAALTLVVGFTTSLASAFMVPAAQALAVRGSPPGQLAAGQGLLEATGFLFAAAAALPIGWVYELVGPGWLGVALALPLALLWSAGWIELRRAATAARVGSA